MPRHTMLALCAIAFLAAAAPAQEEAPEEQPTEDRQPGTDQGLTGERAGKFDGFYMRAGLGLIGFADSDYGAPGGPMREVEFDAGYGGSVALGYDFGSVFRSDAPKERFTVNLRSEVEFSFERADADDVGGAGGAGAPRLERIWTRGLAMNGYVDFDTPTQWTFYAGVGLGAAQVETEGVGFDDRDTVGFVQLMGGAIFDVTERAAFYAGLRSRGYGDLDAGDAELEDLASGTLEVGLIFSF
jgi:opacity protein-like surface antigen